MAITAAARKPKSDVDASVLPVKWSAVPGSDTEAVGHVCFTNEEVMEPREGRLYSGWEAHLSNAHIR